MGVDGTFQRWLSAAAFFGKNGGHGGGKGGSRAAVMDATAIAASSADWAGWQRHQTLQQRIGGLLADMHIDEEKMGRAAWFALVVCAALVASHLLAVAFIAHHDISGKWDRYSLKYQRSTWHTYAQHFRSFFVDVACLLLPALLAFGYAYDGPLFEPLLLHGRPARDVLRLVSLTLAAVLNNVINRLWAMGVHWAMHESKWLYRAVHKRHHCRIRDLCALAAWQDTTLEFVLMEVMGVFLFAQLFNPLPWHFHVLLAAYNGVGGAIDHSAFYIPGTIIDGRYHWDHHVRLEYNFSEIELLDWLFGTLYRPKAKDTTNTITAVPEGEPGLRPGGVKAPRMRRRSWGGGAEETRAPPEREEEGRREAGVRAGSEDAGDVMMGGMMAAAAITTTTSRAEQRGEKEAQSPPRAIDGPGRGGDRGGAGRGGTERRTARPYS